MISKIMQTYNLIFPNVFVNLTVKDYEEKNLLPKKHGHSCLQHVFKHTLTQRVFWSYTLMYPIRGILAPGYSLKTAKHFVTCFGPITLLQSRTVVSVNYLCSVNGDDWVRAFVGPVRPIPWMDL